MTIQKHPYLPHSAMPKMAIHSIQHQLLILHPSGLSGVIVTVGVRVTVIVCVLVTVSVIVIATGGVGATEETDAHQ